MKSTFSEYDLQAADFLNRHAITIAIELSGTKAAPWQPAGYHYSVTLQRAGKRITFDFWGSVRARENGKHPTAYDVLSCISSDVRCPDTFADFCAEYGYDTVQTFRKCSAFAKKLRAFFTAQEINELSEIR